jgi:membrane-bound lytic murein transglycosylase B
VQAQLTPEERSALERQLQDVQAEIQQNQTQLAEQQRKRSSLERDLAILDSKITAAQLAIKQRTLTIQGLKNGIADKTRGIRTLDSKVAQGEDALAEILRQTREIDDLSIVELALGNSLSELFGEIDDFESLRRALDESFTEMAVARSDLSARKQALESQQLEEQQLLQIQELQRGALKKIEQEKQELIAAAKGQEAVYQRVIADRQRTAAEIQSALFDLNGAEATSFGQMYVYATEASAVTGVRPALILAILRQETNLGRNVGQCLLTNQPNKGDGKGVNTGRIFSKVMKPTRDVDPFMNITQKLGINPFAQVVSCPQSGGYGGAMGPAQFIPSTWMLYEGRIAKATGQEPANPWDPRTATFATALLMKDNGADNGTRATERLASLRYFAGWSNASKPSWAFYGDSVMEFADDYQRDIEVLSRS